MILTAGQFSPNKTQVTKSRLLPPTRNWTQRKEILDVTTDDCGTVQQQQLVEAPARGPSHPVKGDRNMKFCVHGAQPRQARRSGRSERAISIGFVTAGVAHRAN
jgi:hypothetical protein